MRTDLLLLLIPMSARYRDMRPAAVAAEEVGFDGLSTWDHLRRPRRQLRPRRAGSGYALRLPVATREAAIAAGAKGWTERTDRSAPDLSVIGEEWVFAMGDGDDEHWWHSALEYASHSDSASES